MKEEREHITDMPYCWCNPRKIVYPNGNMAILHNYNNENNMNITTNENRVSAPLFRVWIGGATVNGKPPKNKYVWFQTRFYKKGTPIMLFKF